ncbi:2Fe-2S iron-sulfur cluster binding domain protein [Candidatus Vecturithrix granuli]|uniref:2Fe-2S iron-sulfur cluster binding domain protein n=1 Tax=Vecturithrix granuli TaxID=1499967 RepID=A0A081CAS4_VECG1|nr:2Fe-2S iron-sulfur cluster binding domain protein [Candidatus Vecturithrix granuli]
MKHITIDDQEFLVEPGKTVLEAAIDAGIYIPNLCYHPDLPPLGACRLCLVEIEGMRGLLPACTTYVIEGMVIRTNTPQLQEFRKNIVWFLLSDHPKELAESSQFQKVAEWVGIKDALPGHVSQPRKLPEISQDEPVYVRDLERCILCERCVRMCQEVRGIGAIGLMNRGIKTYVGTPTDVPVKDSGCKFCEACVEVCPSGALRDKESFTEEEREAFILPCTNTCPAGIDVARYVRLIAEGRYQDAIEVIRETVPFPYSLGCVCPHPCEEECRRGEVNEAISIRALKKFVAQRDTGRWREKLRILPDTGKKVAIVGAGPAGLTAAWFIRKQGHAVTVFEALSKGGGTMRAGIPEYRLPREVLDQEIKDIADIGVEFRYNTKVESLDNLFQQGFDAIFLGLGATRGTTMRIPGEEDARVLDGLSVLWDLNLEGKSDLKGRIAVVGGGNVAIDVARCALRVGAEQVSMLYRRTRQEMPASPEEIEAALNEGVKIDYLVNPIRVIAENNCLKVECIRMELGEPDASGRRRPIPVEGSEFLVEVDRLVMAIGQKAVIPEGIDITLDKRGYIQADESGACPRAGVFTGGDVMKGPATVIEAIQAGRVAASAIDKYLGGTGEILQRFIPEEPENPWLGRDERFAYWQRLHEQEMPVAERLQGFDEVEQVFDEQMALEEAKRCLRCQLRLTISKVPMPPEKAA